MTTISDVGAPAPGPAPAPTSATSSGDHRGSWIPTWSMITTRVMELRKRRGLMIALILVNIGIPTVVLAIRLISHAVAPKSFGPAGGYSIFTAMVATVMYIFGFIVAATVGAAAGSTDLTDGMFRHLVITGRSRLALYLARIPAGLAVVIPIVAVGFAIVCAVCCWAAPTTLNYDGVNVPNGLSRSGLETWAAGHANEVVCDFNYRGPIGFNVPCGGPNGGPGPGGGVEIIKGGSGVVPQPTPATPAQTRADAVKIANEDYSDYHSTFLAPPMSLMIETGLWIALEATIGLIVGLGLASLMGQRTVPVIILIILELVLTPILSRNVITHLLNVQRGIVGVAMAHIEPAALPLPFGGGGGGGGGGGPGNMLVPESRTVAVIVIVGWLVFWTAIGAWRMVKRDA